MSRDIPVGNGSLLVSYDRQGLIRDFYYPYAGMENHAQGHPFRVGAWINGEFSWLDSPAWQRTLDYEEDTLVARIRLTHRTAGVELVFRDAVDFHENIFIREIRSRNLSGSPAELRLFFHHDFHIYGSEIGDTACLKPETSGLLHYKGRRYFLLNAPGGITRFTTGVKEAKGLEGAWVDAEDGQLSGNPIAQGSVDSVFALHQDIPPGAEEVSHYWLAVGEDWKSVVRLNGLVNERSPEYFIKRTGDYWRLWVEKENLDFNGLPETVVQLYKRSLLILRTNINDNGAIIAGADSDIQHYYKDTYSYTWPRDGAIVAHALGSAGYPIPARNFFDFCGRTIGRGGFFLHKYNPDGSLASSWHPWVRDGKPSLPIQEDETALVVWSLWRHFRLYRDIEFVKPLYRKLIKSTADFMCGFTDEATGLPLPSYDLWEERLGVHTYTVCAVIAGLRAAAGFTAAFGETDFSRKYTDTADRMKEALVRHLFHAGQGRFARSLHEGGGLDMTVDASLSGLVLFEVFPAPDERVVSTMRAMKDALWCKTDVGGMARFENDAYQASAPRGPGIPGNPWIVCTLWYAQYLIEIATDEESLEEALSLMGFVSRWVPPSGVMPEQIDPISGGPLSVSPLTWSHAEFVITVQRYLDRLEKIGTCPQCGHPLFMKYKLQNAGGEPLPGPAG